MSEYKRIALLLADKKITTEGAALMAIAAAIYEGLEKVAMALREKK
jgi:hypothetical protein